MDSFTGHVQVFSGQSLDIRGPKLYVLIMFAHNVPCLLSSCHLNSPHAVALYCVSKARVTACCVSNTRVFIVSLSAFPGSPLSEALGNPPSTGVHKGANPMGEKPPSCPRQRTKVWSFYGLFMVGRDPDCMPPCEEVVSDGVCLFVCSHHALSLSLRL